MEGSLEFLYNTDITIGSIQNIMYSKGLVFAPAETDMSIRPGWFYHENEEPHSLERLFNTYINTVCNNSVFNLNIPPMPNGKFDPRDLERLKELGKKLRNEFKTNLAEGIEFQALEGFSETQPEYILKLKQKEMVKYVEIAEKISEGQKVESFVVFYKNKDNLWDEAGKYTTIGSRKIVKIDSKETDEIKIQITSSRDVPIIEWIKVY
jgi:alpha-L-fucosidase